MQEYVLLPINLRNRKLKTRRNEATINHERFAYPQFRIPIEAYLEDTVPWYRIGGSLVIDRDFIHPILFY